MLLIGERHWHTKVVRLNTIEVDYILTTLQFCLDLCDMDISFVFSDKIKFRLARHLLFWLAMLVYQVLVDFIVPTFFEGAKYDALKDSFLLAMIYLPGQFVLTYMLLYFVIPQLLMKSKYVAGIVSIAVLCLLAGFANEVSYRIFTSGSVAFFPDSGKHSLGMHRILGVAGFAACIKYMKHWYEKNYVNSLLEKEKLMAELQTLKAQIHPHFLFNTLNNIYSITENTSKEASDMLMRLSALLRYILYECNKPVIRLGMEFKIIQDYIALESIRYKDLDIQMVFPPEADKYMIAPLLLLPLVENCFKHGTSKVIDQPWIKIEAVLKGSTLFVKLINGKPELPPDENSSPGIGLANVKKRLEFLYPQKHEIKILPEADVFVVTLKLELSGASTNTTV